MDALMPHYGPLVAQISEQTQIAFRAASPAGLARLQALGVPDSVLAFYRDFEPSECAEGQVRLWPIQDILEENESYAPGTYVSKQGYVVFASTLSGDAYCFDVTQPDVSEPRIVLFAHEVIDEDTTPAQISRLAKPVAKTLQDFLQQFIRKEIDERCIYE